MKNTSKQLLVIVLATASFATAAQAQVMGGRTTHVLNCGAPKLNGHMELGVGYKLVCETQAVAPEYSLRDCVLSSHVVAPGAKDRVIAIHQQTQDASAAMFIGAGVTVKVKKSPLSARLIMENGSVASCNEVSVD